jgi:hypothetical protein
MTQITDEARAKALEWLETLAKRTEIVSDCGDQITWQDLYSEIDTVRALLSEQRAEPVGWEILIEEGTEYADPIVCKTEREAKEMLERTDYATSIRPLYTHQSPRAEQSDERKVTDDMVRAALSKLDCSFMCISERLANVRAMLEAALQRTE